MPNYFETNSAPMFAADFPYFRLARQKWELMLVRLRQMGVNALAVNIPWGFHEFERGTIDLNGTTNSRRDLVGLLKLGAAFKFHVILNLGPYNRNGVLGDGLPLWLLRQTDDVVAALPEALANWFKAASETLCAQQWPAGPVVALQIDDEPSQSQAEALSPQLTEVKWRIWLRKHYDGIEALNTAYGTTYHTVNEVKFPADWSGGTTPLQRDAQAFLAEVQRDSRAGYRQLLLDAGWQIPIYLSTPEMDSGLPSWRRLNLSQPAELATLPVAEKDGHEPLLILHQPIQIDPDPADVGCGSVWAENAPIRADGSLWPTFWPVRQWLWPQTFPQAQVVDQTLIVPFPGGTALTRGSDSSLKIGLTAGAKSAIYRLGLTGQLLPDDRFKVSRSKLNGLYRAVADSVQTDLILVLNDSAAPLGEFTYTYLSYWLTAQAQTLTRCAELAAAVGQTLADPSAPARPAKSSYLLTEARRGLSEADVALRKALASISELEGGFATILGKSGPQPVKEPVRVSPDIFEAPAREVLAEVGAACAKIAPSLQSAAANLERTLAASPGFTVEQYQQSYVTAVTTAQTARTALLKVIALLRLEIASEKLPLVAWRVHDQIQELAENLRWGIGPAHITVNTEK